MADATRAHDSTAERQSLQTKLDALFDTFWMTLASRGRQAAEQRHAPNREPEHTHQKCTGPRPKRLTRWCRRKKPIPPTYKQGRLCRTTRPTQRSSQALHRPSRQPRPTTQPATGRFSTRLRTHPKPQRAPGYQRGTLLTYLTGTGPHYDRRTSQPQEPATLHLAVPQRDSHTPPISFPVMGVG
ncbi:Hypothetical predicted protein [Pelobates cultripes]|nr:Hypothetical predicted protein [Pelobates cultripes]